MRESSNPAFSSLTQTVARGTAGVQGYGQQQYDADYGNPFQSHGPGTSACHDS